jgi:hypothetical protein
VYPVSKVSSNSVKFPVSRCGFILNKNSLSYSLGIIKFKKAKIIVIIYIVFRLNSVFLNYQSRIKLLITMIGINASN